MFFLLFINEWINLLMYDTLISHILEKVIWLLKFDILIKLIFKFFFALNLGMLYGSKRWTRYDNSNKISFLNKNPYFLFISTIPGIRTNSNYTMILNERFQEMIDQFTLSIMELNLMYKGFAFFYWVLRIEWNI